MTVKEDLDLVDRIMDEAFKRQSNLLEEAGTRLLELILKNNRNEAK